MSNMSLANVNNNYNINHRIEEWFKSFPKGFRFNPQDDELIDYYLKPKLLNSELPPNKIADVELYSYNPDKLVALYKSYGEGEWYFFTPRKKKYPNGSRPDRGAGDGYWKATGADKIIKSEDGVEIGRKKALVFYAGKAKEAKKTNWIMHEYKLLDPPLISNPSQDKMQLDDWILCKIHKTKSSKEKTLVVPAAAANVGAEELPAAAANVGAEELPAAAANLGAEELPAAAANLVAEELGILPATLVVPAANVGAEELGILPASNKRSIDDMEKEHVQVRLPPASNESSMYDIRSEQFQARLPPALNGPSIYDIRRQQFQARLPPNGSSIYDMRSEDFQAHLPPALNGPSIYDIRRQQFQARLPPNESSIYDMRSEDFQAHLPPTRNGPSIFDGGEYNFQAPPPPTFNGPSVFDMGSEHVLPPTLINGPSTNIGREQVQLHLPPTWNGPAIFDLGSEHVLPPPSTNIGREQVPPTWNGSSTDAGSKKSQAISSSSTCTSSSYIDWNMNDVFVSYGQDHLQQGDLVPNPNAADFEWLTSLTD